MTSEIVNRKLSLIYDNYQEKSYAREAQKDVEGLRNKASNLGLGITLGAFVLNEVARMSLRSRKYFVHHILTFVYLQHYSNLIH